MLASLSHLIRDGRYGRARVTELARLLARFEAEPDRSATERLATDPIATDPRVRALALRVLTLKREVTEALSAVRACSGCARSCPAPSGFFEGGRCCGTATLDVFTPPEVRAMKLAGVGPPMEPAATGDERAGCVFRGRTGCVVSVEQRPARCVVYVCHELRIELEESGGFERVERLRRQLESTFAELERLTR
jgi:hypothetical protein